MWFPFNFEKKKIKGPSSCDGWVKELETFPKLSKQMYFRVFWYFGLSLIKIA